MRKVTLLLIAVVAIFATALQGVELSKVEVGRAKPTWRDLPGVDGKNHSLADLQKTKVVVVAITCNHCPIAMEYFDRLKEFAETRCNAKGNVALIAISLSDMEADKLPRMKDLADRNGFNFPYLRDESQQVGRQLGATSTPQFFVLNAERTLVYRGAWDDNVNSTKVQKHYVEDAVNALLAGKSPAMAETKSIGCVIKYRQ